VKLHDSRRLTGANLMAPSALAVLEVSFAEGEDADAAIAAFVAEVTRLVAADSIVIRRFAGGAALGVRAPSDELLVATDVNEWALERANAVLAGQDPGPEEPGRSMLLAALAAARNPSLRALATAAAARGLPCLLDDEEVSIGLGSRSRSWPINALPATAEVPWDALGRILVALITGTNGKTTCARLLARVLHRSGLRTGLASSGGIVIGDTLVDAGDWTGPAAARLVLRRPDVDIAVLETARGGILRRGLGLDQGDAALITNVSEDHFGDYGVFDLPTMVAVKAVVARAVVPSGKLVLGAACDALMAVAGDFAVEQLLFARDGHHPRLLAHRARGGEVWFVADGQIVRARSTTATAIVPVAEIPITFGGAALFNVDNALAVAALGSALGVSDADLAAGLVSFRPSVDDNPGRGNLVTVGGIRVLLDFAHNPEGLRAAMSLVETLRGGSRLLVVFSQPGDRSDEAIVAATHAVLAAKPDRLLVHDMAGYLRGRMLGETTRLVADAATGVTNTTTHPDETTALGLALDEAVAGDLVVVLPHLEVESVTALLSARA